jgi:hypothetical protein
LSPPVGPTGLPETCDGDGPPTYQATLAADGMSTEIDFDGALVPVRELATTATLGHFATPRLGWTITAGAIVGGSIEGRPLDGGARSCQVFGVRHAKPVDHCSSPCVSSSTRASRFLR